MYNFIHRTLVKDGSFSRIIQPNNDNFVLLVIEQSPYPGEENSHSRAADPPPATPAAWPPPAQAQGEERDAPEPRSLPPLLPRWPSARFLGTGGRPKPRPPCRARGPAAAAAAPAWLADIAAAWNVF